MRQSKGPYVVALILLLVPFWTIRQWYETGHADDLLMAVVFALLAIVLAITRFRVRKSPAGPESDPRVLRRIATVGGIAGSIALIALLWRVHGQWILLGESFNLVLAMIVIFGFVCAAFGALYLKEQREH